MKNVLTTVLAFLLIASSAMAREICVMQFNVWQEGTMIPGGFDAMADEIARQQPDLVMLSEVRNYRGTRFCDRIVQALAERGYEYHSFYSSDTGLLSRTEVADSATVFPLKDDHGSVYKLVTYIDGRRIAAYTAHFDYQNDTYYEPRGYSGVDWSEIEPVTDEAELMRRNLLSLRDEAAEAAVADIARERDCGSLVFFAGDLNEPSGQDWTEATASTADHRGVVIDWPSVRILREGGLVDAYRQMWPDPLTHPGYTYPSSNPDAEVKRLSWAMKADERDRIDYVFYVPDESLELLRVYIVGPQEDIVRGERTLQEWGKRDIVAPLGIWPSDHRAVVARFNLR